MHKFLSRTLFVLSLKRMIFFVPKSLKPFVEISHHKCHAHDGSGDEGGSRNVNVNILFLKN
jgi:hypothetical protein